MLPSLTKTPPRTLLSTLFSKVTFLLYFLEIFLPFIFLPLTFILIDAYPLTIIEICLMYLSCFTLASVISFVFSKTQFGYILNLLHDMYPNVMDEIELEYSKK